eukprot:TRINITY_DN33563_c0_g1_i1.p1 TRINITY_DN33563_c0_g1~~TRINITY_DN33563_c0_g1_i1.p1  ORF type:complete len:389 (+),score=88.97 TRINITY_DN33563_c0_g1_i1:140-1306(+)
MIWDASDANPMHRRIPAEVVSRRIRPTKKPPHEPEKDPDEVVVDLKTATNLKPEARSKWLSKAFKMVTDGNAPSTDLYNILVSRRFASGVHERVARKLVSVIKENLSVFSDKQRRYLESNDCPLMTSLSMRDEVEAEELAVNVAAVDASAAAAAREAQAAAAAAAADADAAVAAVEGRWTQAVDLRSEDSLRMNRQPTRQRVEDSGAKWQVAEDEAAVRRQAALAEEWARKEASRKEEKRRKDQADEEDARKQEEEMEAARRRKLEEEADDIFMRALESKAVSSSVPPRRSNDEGRGGSRSVSRSRSISSRTARRNTRPKPPARRESWRTSMPSGGVLSGSRAIFMNRDFVEDLPHLPRPSNPGTTGLGPRRASSRSASRSRHRSRRR